MDLRPRVRSGKETAEKTWNLVKHVVSVSRSSEKAWTGFSFQCTENARTEGDQDDGDDEDKGGDDDGDQDDGDDEDKVDDDDGDDEDNDHLIKMKQWHLLQRKPQRRRGDDNVAIYHSANSS